ncbi:MAG: hypothetical protein V4699_01430 [Patescibacteria group bacterium]
MKTKKTAFAVGLIAAVMMVFMFTGCVSPEMRHADTEHLLVERLTRPDSRAEYETTTRSGREYSGEGAGAVASVKTFGDVNRPRSVGTNAPVQSTNCPTCFSASGSGKGKAWLHQEDHEVSGGMLAAKIVRGRQKGERARRPLFNPFATGDGVNTTAGYVTPYGGGGYGYDGGVNTTGGQVTPYNGGGRRY